MALHFNAQSPAMVRSIVFADFAAKPAENSNDTVIARREAIAYISMPEFATQYAAEHLMFTTSARRSGRSRRHYRRHEFKDLSAGDAADFA